jgi:hypothetical protein
MKKYYKNERNTSKLYERCNVCKKNIKGICTRKKPLVCEFEHINWNNNEPRANPT